MSIRDDQERAKMLKAWFDENAADNREYSELNDQEKRARVDLQNIMQNLVNQIVDKQTQSYVANRSTTPANVYQSHSMPIKNPEGAKEMLDILFDTRRMSHFTQGALIQQAWDRGDWHGESRGYDRGRKDGKEEGYKRGNFDGKVKGFLIASVLVGVIAVGVNMFKSNKKDVVTAEDKVKTEQLQKSVVPALAK